MLLMARWLAWSVSFSHIAPGLPTAIAIRIQR
jgi:hypothetical protein